MDLTPITLYIDSTNSKNKEFASELSSVFTIVDSVPDSKFFYPIFLTSEHPFIYEVKVPEPILNCVHAGTCLVLIIHHNEGYSWHRYEKIVITLQANNNLTDDNIVFITNNSETSLRFKSITCNYWEPTSFSQNIISEKRLGRWSVLEKDSREYKFVCLNRICHPHRFATVSALYPYRDQGLLSFQNSLYDVNKDYYRIRSFEVFQSTYKSYSEQWINLNLPKDLNLILPEELDNTLASTSPVIIDNCTKKFYESYLHIVSETLIDHVFFSEKTFKPIKYFQPFVMINGQFSLQYLRRMGYKTFSNYIDESYDVEPDPNQRLTMAMEASLNFISRLDLHDVMKEMYPIFEHNHNNFMLRCKNFQSTLHNDISKILHIPSQL